MAEVSLSSAVRQALSAIRVTADQAETQQLRLATGKRVNSAIDNPTNFFTSAGLSNRARDLGNLLDSIGQATKTLDAADKGIKGLTKLIESAQGAARQALQSASTTAKVVSQRSDLAATNTLVTAGVAGFTAGKVIKVNGNTVLTVAAGSTVQDLIDGINNNTTLNPAGSAQKVRASLDNGQLRIEGIDGTSGVAVTTDDAVTTTNTLFGASTSLTATATTNTERSNLSKQFDALRTQIDQLANDSGYNGINLLKGDSLKVQFNEKNTSSVTISGVTFNASGLGVNASTYSLQSDHYINTSLNELTTALTNLRSQASTFGSNLSVVQTRQEFTQNIIDTLNTGSDLLVNADQNEEAAKLVTLNTRQQLATTALSLANQSQQSVLRLF